ncbi:Uncharacterised protein [Candidatus Gugararchaeum adminiculabundum]|nr:Uncharacterised protein [Candidatus Gugararchaeum adminiculabundum]
MPETVALPIQGKLSLPQSFTEFKKGIMSTKVTAIGLGTVRGMRLSSLIRIIDIIELESQKSETERIKKSSYITKEYGISKRALEKSASLFPPIRQSLILLGISWKTEEAPARLRNALLENAPPPAESLSPGLRPARGRPVKKKPILELVPIRLQATHTYELAQIGLEALTNGKPNTTGREVARLLQSECGYKTPKEIAREFNCSTDPIDRRIANNPSEAIILEFPSGKTRHYLPPSFKLGEVFTNIYDIVIDYAGAINKINPERAYTFAELGELLGIDKWLVKGFMNMGLPATKSNGGHSTFLVQGEDIRYFLGIRSALISKPDAIKELAIPEAVLKRHVLSGALPVVRPNASNKKFFFFNKFLISEIQETGLDKWLAQKPPPDKYGALQKEGAKWSRQKVIDGLLEFGKKHKGEISKTALRENDQPLYGAACRLFPGGLNGALLATTEYLRQEGKPKQAKKFDPAGQKEQRTFSRKFIVNEIIKIFEEHGVTELCPTAMNKRDSSLYKHSKNYFRNYQKAVFAAKREMVRKNRPKKDEFDTSVIFRSPNNWCKRKAKSPEPEAPAPEAKPRAQPQPPALPMKGSNGGKVLRFLPLVRDCIMEAMPAIGTGIEDGWLTPEEALAMLASDYNVTPKNLLATLEFDRQFNPIAIRHGFLPQPSP